MPTHTVFCSACDRNVRLVARSADWIWHIILDRQAHEQVACLEQGVRCTGSLCPFSAVVPDGGARKEASRAGTNPAN